MGGAELGISLGLLAIRLASQWMAGRAEAKQQLDELEAYFVLLHEEERGPTREERDAFVARAAAADDSLQAALERLRARVEGPAPEE